MLLRHLIASSLSLALLSLTACGGGQGGPSTDRASSCGEASVFCLSSCNVGCVQSGCEIREIAQNHQLRFRFSQEVDPRTVDFTTISLKTATGEEPVGKFVVEGAVITFVPAVRTVGAATFFGFTPNEEYILTLPGGPAAPVSLESMTGDKLESQFSCTMRVTQGIVDIDGQAPEASVLSPTTTGEIPRDSQFVLQFSEVIDHGPFIINPTGVDAPVQFLLLPRLTSGDCNLAAQQPPRIFGTIRLEDDVVGGITTLTFTPSQSLPGNRCVECRVTGRTRDLAGTAALPQSFLFRTDSSTVLVGSVEEEFNDALMLDVSRSAGNWDAGFGTFLSVGGDGRHGDFDHTRGTLTDGEYVFDTSAPFQGDVNALVPLDNPNGVFQFTNFIVPTGVKVRFTGTDALRLHVRGECDVRGELLVGGKDLPQWTDVENGSRNAAGQPGGAAGPGGGDGGSGGQQCNGNGDLPENDGVDGVDIRVAASHAYAGQAAGTGGRGSEMFPVDGLSSSLLFNVFSYSGIATNGGGGGGFLGAGGDGRVIEWGRAGADPTIVPTPAGPTAGGSTFQMFPLPGGSSLDHYQVGGSGGGGGGSHPFYRRNFMSGAAGGGGGGAVAMRVGRSFKIPAGGAINNRGGTSFQFTTNQGIGRDFAAPGGGGSGGSLLIQLGDTNDVVLQGSLDCRGGGGGFANLTGTLFRGNVVAGDGADGLYRFEAPTPIQTSGWQLNAQPAPTPESSGTLNETDDLVGFMSRYYDSGLAVAPVYTHYVVDAIVDGANVTFSDDPAIGIAAGPGAAIQIFLQGVNFDPATGEPDTSDTPTQWYSRVASEPGVSGLNDGQRTGFRWSILADYRQATTVVIDKVTVFFNF